MNIEVDYNPSPSNQFFISVSLNKKEAVSFDYTSKGHRVIKQVLVDKKPFPENEKISGEWDTLIVEDRKLIKKHHVKWIDLDKRDWCNEEIWETVVEKSILEELKDELLRYSQLVSDNYKDLDKISEEMKKFEKLLKKEVNEFLKQI